MAPGTERSVFDSNQNTEPIDKAPTCLLEMIGASWMSQAISVAAELRLADLMVNGSQSVDVLALATKCERASLHRLLRALTSLDLFIEQEDRTFSLTATGAWLRADAPQSVRSWAIWCGQYHWPLWADLLASVKTGISARALATGSQGYAHIESDPQGASVFNQAMVEITRLIADEMARAADFSQARHVVDVGGGFGGLLMAILSANPHLRGTLFDLPHAIAGATALLGDAGVGLRCEIVTGSFFDTVPGGADIYLLKSILHNWDDEKSAVILGNCRRAMAADARLILVERLMPTRMRTTAVDRAIARSDLNMLVGLAGRERTVAELASLLATSGFKVTGSRAVTLEYSVVEAVPA